MVDERFSNSVNQPSLVDSGYVSRHFLYGVLMIYGLAQRFGSTTIYNSGRFFIKNVEELKQDHLVMDYLLVILTSVRFVLLIFSSHLLKWGNPLKTVIYSQLGTCVILLVFASLVFIKTINSMVFMGIVLFGVFNYALIYVISFLGIFKLLSKLHPRFTHAYSTGQGMAGITTTSIKLLTIILSLSESGERGSFIFFITSSTVILVAMILLKIALTRIKTLIPELDSDNNLEPQPLRKLFVEYYRIYKDTRITLWCIAIHYFQDIFLVPNFFYMVRSTGLWYWRLTTLEAFPIFSYFLYCIGDYIGRFVLASRYSIQTPRYLILGTIISNIYFPIFIFSNVHIIHVDYPFTRWLASDLLFTVASVTLGMIMGYLSTSILMNFPSSVKNPNDRKHASNLMAYFIAFGLMTGSTTSLVLKILLQRFFPINE